MIPGLIDITPDPNIGPLPVGWYGVGYVVGLAVLVLVTQRELARRGIEPSHATGALVTTAILAIVGGRLYHVIHEWDRYAGDLAAIVLPPYSGLGLFGGVAGAIVGIVIYTRRRGIPLWRALDAVVPGTLFAQGIARWGNFFNQELYGPPTDAAWGIAIECEHRIAPYFCPGDPQLAAGAPAYPFETTGFHPLFFYESALTIAGGLLALWIGRRLAIRLRDGDIASFWAIWYGAVRTLLETFREDYNWTVSGIPTAQLIGLALIAFGVVTIAWQHRGPARPGPGEAAEVEVEDHSAIERDPGLEPSDARPA